MPFDAVITFRFDSYLKKNVHCCKERDKTVSNNVSSNETKDLSNLKNFYTFKPIVLEC